jgi:hypothetical protein
MTTTILRGVRVQDEPVRHRTRDTFLSPVTSAELAAAGAANYNPAALGRIWDGIAQALQSVDELPAAVRDAVGRKIMAYGEQEGWKVDNSGAYVTNDGHKMSDGAQQAAAMRDLTTGINAANKKFWADNRR